MKAGKSSVILRLTEGSDGGKDEAMRGGNGDRRKWKNCTVVADKRSDN